MQVPFLDLKAQYNKLRNEINGAIQAVIDDTAFADGPYVKRFEGEFAAYCGAQHAIGVGNGTDALWLSLAAIGIGAGDEVITTPNTFIATAEAISLCGAKPVFVDIDEATYTMRVDEFKRSVTPRTKAVIPVHLFGQTADMAPILAAAGENGLFVIEDACQAHGAKYHDQSAGTLGQTGCFSFYPGKNLGAYGEAGAVITNNPELADKMRIFRNHGQPCKYIHSMIGWNARMDGIQAAVLSVKLKHLDDANTARRSHAERYRQLLADVPGLVLPREAAYARHVYHVFAVRVSNRDSVLSRLSERGVGCGVHYPVPLHLQEAYRSLGYKRGDFPVSEHCADEFLSLPMFPELTESQIEYTATVLREVLG
jgi:dTDP-4-amino-4,6-dideoxygalactose transaminase